MKNNVFYENEIEYARSFFNGKLPNVNIIGDNGNYFYDVLKDVFSNNFGTDSNVLIAVLYGSDNKALLMNEVANVISSGKYEKCIICDENTLPYNNSGYIISEREYLCLSEDKTLLDKIKTLQKAVPTNLLVFDKIIGPGSVYEKFIIISNKVTVTDADLVNVCGYTYIRDALSAVLLSLNTLKDGNIYNVSSFILSDYELKQKIHSLFSERFSIDCSLNACNKNRTKALCALKIKAKGFKATEIDEAVYLTVSSEMNFDYEYTKTLNQYCSKLQILKKTEIEILKEIDRICKKNNINYFLTGGSLLGAVRYGKSIPWDDDLDIGMLREDFEKFRKICPNEIDKTRFAYASYTTEKNCHYLFDKIRLKNTYFSTEFSSQYKIQDGIFVDIFVYDATSTDKKKQSLHINLVKTAIRFLNLKWTGKADRNMNGYRLTRMIRPFITKLPFGLIHKFAEKMLQLYKDKESGLLIDGTGLNINRGAFSKDFLKSTTEVEFEGFLAPIPQKYDCFLKHIYGENYMQEPSLYKRSGTHDFVRLDLGEYISEENEIAVNQSLNGELFEED